jgi:hypothetical protein
VLAAYVEQWGGLPTRWPIVPDELEAIVTAVQQAATGHDLILVNAGSSAGSKDYTAHVVQSLGQLIVHGVAVRPGHPVILGVVARGGGAGEQGSRRAEEQRSRGAEEQGSGEREEENHSPLAPRPSPLTPRPSPLCPVTQAGYMPSPFHPTAVSSPAPAATRPPVSGMFHSPLATRYLLLCPATPIGSTALPSRLMAKHWLPAVVMRQYGCGMVRRGTCRRCGGPNGRMKDLTSKVSPASARPKLPP